MKKGFTLIEIMIVVVIAVSVAAFAVPAYQKSQDQNRYLAAEGMLIEVASGLHNVQQLYKVTGCGTTKNVSSILTTSVPADQKNDDGTLTQAGCKAYPRECLFKNGYTKSTPTTVHEYVFSIDGSCQVCMTRPNTNTKRPSPYKVCIDAAGVEYLTYPNGATGTRGN